MCSCFKWANRLVSYLLLSITWHFALSEWLPGNCISMRSWLNTFPFQMINLINLSSLSLHCHQVVKCSTACFPHDAHPQTRARVHSRLHFQAMPPQITITKNKDSFIHTIFSFYKIFHSGNILQRRQLPITPQTQNQWPSPRVLLSSCGGKDTMHLWRHTLQWPFLSAENPFIEEIN